MPKLTELLDRLGQHKRRMVKRGALAHIHGEVIIPERFKARADAANRPTQARGHKITDRAKRKARAKAWVVAAVNLQNANPTLRGNALMVATGNSLLPPAVAA